MVGRSVRPCDDLKYRVSVTRLGECQTVARGYSSNKNHGLCPLHVPSSLQLFHVQWYLILLVKHSLGRVTRSPERDSRMRASLHGLGTLFFLSAVSFSTRRSQSVKLGYVCSLCHARSESLGNRTLFSLPFFPLSLPFPSLSSRSSLFLFFFIFFPFFFFILFPPPASPCTSPDNLSSHPFATGEIGFFHCTATSWHENTRGIQAAKSKQPFFPNRNLDYTRGGCKCTV